MVNTLPPRYAVESDEEDEFNHAPSSSSPPRKIDVAYLGPDVEKGKDLVIASGVAAAVWARGAHLGEQIGAITVNKIQIGLVFQPSYTKSYVLASEALVQLPLDHMHPYASKTLEIFQPSSISLLDVYSAPTYASQAPVRILDAPIRFLSTTKLTFDPKSLNLAPFEPPNLLSSTSASFISLASLPNPMPTPAAAFLLPSSQTPAPRPKALPSPSSSLSSSIVPSTTDSPSEGIGPTLHPSSWDTSLLQTAHRALFLAINQDISGSDGEWKGKDGAGGLLAAEKRRSEVGEGGMYL
ncbi:hypothetical protein CC1G_09903 [Coprinopsis cinerea okayama7|uniref:Proteasome assembly chaperone 1 n=1 Tax=Coprinopsis cinerea (strain Okayama-7 / 130 / ATCC MYA-4618 / FGSC 9003) TaxID=240176 RepID=A8NMY5_COPC7|nr:hypothetical protein CC1G_09903 [Coprinopsis cinerea okayama7\|eukprot:XP_001835012.2 hypothetical protein CC1G_09903 [Coprinopsis cinerea okayama7\